MKFCSTLQGRLRLHFRSASLLGAALVSLGMGNVRADSFSEVIGPVVSARCVKCHGAAAEIAGDVNLRKVASLSDLMNDPDLIRTLLEVLDEGSMPPEDEPPLPAPRRQELVGHLRRLLHAALAEDRRFPRTPMRRLNRFQYSNAVRDLFQLNVEVFSLPEQMLREYGDYFQPASGRMPDDLRAGSRPLGKSQLISKRLEGVAPFPQDLRAENGFDNRGDHLSLSPLLMESFLKLSRSIVDSKDFHEQTCGIWDEFFAEPTEGPLETAVRTRLQRFLSRAFRRPVDEQTLTRYTLRTVDRISSGESFVDGMKGAAAAAIASPRFLYLFEHASRGDKPEPVDDFELASRLSFFLWSSLPDEALLAAAAQGTLREPDRLAAEADRMLNDRKTKRFCDSFPSQWLQLERIVSSVPDPQLFPEFYFAKYRVSMHMMLEPLLLCETVLVENRSILDLIDSDFSYRSDLLESWYESGKQSTKVPPTAVPFRRVSLPDRRQGGVITNAAVMTMTSGPTRTKPITRGAWLATVIFNDAPDPPPADVPPLSEDGDDAANLTLRQRFEAHRRQAACAGCHEQIDPLGFALENYGPTGVWRDEYENGTNVDAGGTLFQRHQFSNVVEFKDAILTEKERFARAFAAHLMAYALGREVETADWPALEQIVERTAADEYRFREMMKQVILSEPFLLKFNPTEPPAHAD